MKFYQLAKVLTVVLLSASASNLHSQEIKAKLRIGAILPLTGPLANYGRAVLNGMNLALDNLRETDSELANLIAIVPKDDRSELDDIQHIAERLISTRQVDLFFGSVSSSATLSIIKSIKDASHPVIVPVSSVGRLTSMGKHIFRTSIEESLASKAVAWFASQTLNKKTAAILSTQDSPAAQIMAQSFRTEFEKLGGRIIAVEAYGLEDQAFAKQLQRIKKSKAETVYIPGDYRNVGLILREAAATGLRVPMLGGAGWNSPRMVEIAGRRAISGHYFFSGFAKDDPDGQVEKFVQDYQRRFREAPSELSVLGYDGLMVAADAFKRAKTNLKGPLIRALSTTVSATGLLGNISMTNGRNVLKSATILKTSAGGPRFGARIALTNLTSLEDNL